MKVTKANITLPTELRVLAAAAMKADYCENFSSFLQDLIRERVRNILQGKHATMRPFVLPNEAYIAEKLASEVGMDEQEAEVGK